MRVLVVGAGIIGSIYGWALSESGHHVVHLVRSGRAAALRGGLEVDVFDRRKVRKRKFCGLYRLDAVETLSPTDSFEFVIVAVKHYALLQTLREIVPRAGAAEFVLLTQNWRGVAEIDPILPRARYVYGDAKAGGTLSGGKLVAAPAGSQQLPFRRDNAQLHRVHETRHLVSGLGERQASASGEEADFRQTR